MIVKKYEYAKVDRMKFVAVHVIQVVECILP